MSETDIVRMLDARYSATNPGNGPRYATARHVKSQAGFYARRSMDYFAIDLWPSSGLPMIGHEIKCSRSDWLRELKDPDKAETFKRYMNRWYLVASDKALVKPEELPAGWGLLVPVAGGLRAVVSAPVLHPEPMPQTMLACLLRATQLHAFGRGQRHGYETWTTHSLDCEDPDTEPTKPGEGFQRVARELAAIRQDGDDETEGL